MPPKQKAPAAPAPEPASAPAPEPAALAPPPEPSVLAGFVTQPELAREFRVTRRTFQRWEAAGSAPPSVKIGIHRYYNIESAKIWMAARESKPTKRSRRPA